MFVLREQGYFFIWRKIDIVLLLKLKVDILGKVYGSHLEPHFLSSSCQLFLESSILSIIKQIIV